MADGVRKSIDSGNCVRAGNRYRTNHVAGARGVNGVNRATRSDGFGTTGQQKGAGGAENRVL
jgi:hypothetical protein